MSAHSSCGHFRGSRRRALRLSQPPDRSIGHAAGGCLTLCCCIGRDSSVPAAASSHLSHQPVSACECGVHCQTNTNQTTRDSVLRTANRVNSHRSITMQCQPSKHWCGWMQAHDLCQAGMVHGGQTVGPPQGSTESKQPTCNMLA